MSLLKVHLPYIILVSGVLMFADCVSPEPSDSSPQICSASLSSHNKCNLPISSLYKINLGETSHNVHHLTRDESPDTSSTTSGSEPKTQPLIWISRRCEKRIWTLHWVDLFRLQGQSLRKYAPFYCSYNPLIHGRWLGLSGSEQVNKESGKKRYSRKSI